MAHLQLMIGIGRISIFKILIALLTVISTINLVCGQNAGHKQCAGASTATKPNPTMMRPNPPRVYPFCIGPDPETNKWEKRLTYTGFTEIIDEIDKLRNGPNQSPPFAGFKYDKTLHLFDQPSTASQPPTMRLQTHVFTHESAHSTAQMDNWLLLEFTGLFQDRKQAIRPIIGFYIQGMMGPLGIPFGEFIHLRFEGTSYDDIPDFQELPPPDWNDISLTHPCTFYSKAGPAIPNVFMWSNKLNQGGANRKLTGRVHAVFKWDDPVCAEVAFMQFLVIVVYDWDDTKNPDNYRVGISPIVFPGHFKFSPNGVAYPYYPDWGPVEVESTHTSYQDQAVHWNEVTDHRGARIVANFDYEACVQHHVGLEKKGPRKGACPPGPFRCSKSIGKRPTTRQGLKDWKHNLWLHWQKNYLNFQADRADCDTVAPVPTTTEGNLGIITTTTVEPNPHLVEKEKVIAVAAKRAEQKKVISHGDLCVLVWYVLIPFANYVARFFKDFPNWPGIGVGFWIVSHVIVHHIGVLFMWVSFGLVVSNGVSFLGGARLAHYLYAFPATLIQHYELFDGFIRDRRLPTASRQSAFHVINGYLAGFLCLCCCGYSSINYGKFYIVIALFVTDVLALICGSILEWKISKKLGFYPARKYFPVLERVMMVNSKPRFYKLKIILACVYILLISLLYMAYFIHDNHLQSATSRLITL